MRAVKALFGAAVLVALAGNTAGVRADDYNKMMTFTFANPVQLPGVTLEPGDYMFKLADPESGRRTVQVWDKDGSKMYTMALTMVDRRMEAAADPTKIKDGLVMFGEQPAGSPQAIRTWFYTGDTIGYEFVYPKDQAAQIAKAYHTPVLAMTDAGSSDAAALRGTKVGRIDENGQFTDDSSSVTATTASPASTSTTATTASSTTTADSASTTAASTTTADSASTTTADRSSLTPSANRTPPSSPSTNSRVADTTTTANAAASQSAAVTAQEPRPVGTAGQDTARPTDTTRQADASLPKTASPLATMELMSGLSMLLGLGVRQLRRRHAAQ